MDVLSLLDTLQAIARNGLTYATNPYDRERYERLIELATHAYGELFAVPAEEIRSRYWHANHQRYARAAHAMWKSEALLPALSD